MGDAEPARMDELRNLVADLHTLQLHPREWGVVEDALADAVAGRGEGVDELARVVFEGRVRSRFAGAKTGAGIPPTKQTSILPWVGLICGGLLFGIGALLGGGIILVGVGLLSVFIFAVAYAGSTVAHRRPDRSGTDDDAGLVPMPESVAVWVAGLEHR